MTDHPSDSLNGQDLWEVLGRFVAGELTPAQSEQVRQWIGQDQSHQLLVDTLTTATAGLRAQPPKGLNVEAALQRVRTERDKPKVFRLRDWSREWTGPLLRIAAVLTLAVGGTALWQAFAGQLASAETYVTAVGHTKTIKLRDGSWALLGPSSTLVVEAGYFASGRVVTLTGEAFFDVKHNPAMPFRVHAGNAEVEDVGTTFNVRSEPDGEVQVVVASGSVAMQDSTHHQAHLLLKAGDRGTLSRNHASVAEHGVDTTAVLAWTLGKVRFDNAPLSRVRTELKRWYGVELDVSDSSLASRHVTASFGTEPAGKVVSIIALTVGATVEQHGDTMVLKATHR